MTIVPVIGYRYKVKYFTFAHSERGGDTCVIKGRSIKLKASGGAFYTWQADESIVSGANTSSPVVMPEIETTYFVQIKDANGCIQFDSVAVCIIEDPLSLLKQVDAITPNEDGFNDQLEFIGLGGIPQTTVSSSTTDGEASYTKTSIPERWGAI